MFTIDHTQIEAMAKSYILWADYESLKTHLNSTEPPYFTLTEKAFKQAEDYYSQKLATYLANKTDDDEVNNITAKNNEALNNEKNTIQQEAHRIFKEQLIHALNNDQNNCLHSLKSDETQDLKKHLQTKQSTQPECETKQSIDLQRNQLQDQLKKARSTLEKTQKLKAEFNNQSVKLKQAAGVLNLTYGATLTVWLIMLLLTTIFRPAGAPLILIQTIATVAIMAVGFAFITYQTMNLPTQTELTDIITRTNLNEEEYKTTLDLINSLENELAKLPNTKDKKQPYQSPGQPFFNQIQTSNPGTVNTNPAQLII